MRYSNTAITELSKKYRTILKKCAILNAVALLALSTPAMAEVFKPIENNKNATVTTLSPTDGIVEITTSDRDGIFVSETGAGADITANRVSITTTAEGNYSTIWATNHTDETTPPDNAAYINITADEINLSGVRKAVTAMSNGIINLTGNTTISAEDAILTRGYAKININTTDTSKTLKMDGNINFNYNDDTSKSPIDSHVKINLNGASSSWTGNTVKSWDSEPTDADKLIVSDATVTLNDGATWNATKITATDTMKQTALNYLIVKKGTINVTDGATALVGDLTVTDLTLNGMVEANTATFEAGSKLTTALDDTVKIKAKKVTIGDGSTLNLIIDGAVEEKSYNFIDSADITGAFTIADNGLYSFTQDETGTITASQKNADEIAADTGASAQETSALLAMINADGNSTEQGNELASALSTAMQSGDAAVAVQAAKEAAPTTAQVVTGLTKETANTIAQVSTTRLDSIKGTSGGDTVTGAGLWVQGLYNHTKQSTTSSSDGFKANSRGLAVGADAELSETTTLGLGYGYMETDADTTGRDITVDSHNVFVYGEYQPSDWYVNAVLNYGFAKYKEDKAPLGVALKSKYDVKSYGASIMTGYDFDNGITPEAGLRYLIVDAESYNDGAQDINSKKNDILTAVAGVKYTANVKADKAILKPTVRLAATYDIVSDSDEASVQVLGGGNYTINGQRLHRFGVEAGAGVTATVNNWDFTLEYNGAFREDYRSQGGIVRARYNF